jgi:2-polyprenyl-6-methoxyphenol hydroxylase-like FAD-dependent oxidoreductase
LTRAPVGLTLAIDLGKQGIACIPIEQKPAPQFLPKMERYNERTMEMFRRPGLAKNIRAAGLQSHLSMDIFVILE